MNDPLQDLAEMAKTYYDALRQRNIPQPLAERFAVDWHQAMLDAVVNRREQATQVASTLTRQIVKGRQS